MAEAFYNYFTQSNDAWSAGVDLTTPERYPHVKNHPSAEFVIRVMKEEGIDVSEQKVKMVTKKMVENSERIVVMCKKKDCPGFLLEYPKITFWDIKDPYGLGLEGTREVRGIIKSKVLFMIG